MNALEKKPKKRRKKPGRMLWEWSFKIQS